MAVTEAISTKLAVASQLLLKILDFKLSPCFECFMQSCSFLPIEVKYSRFQTFAVFWMFF